MNTRSERLAPTVFALLFVFAFSGYGQQSRISTRINGAESVVFRGHLNPKARPEYDRGAVASTFPLAAMTLHLKPSPAQQVALDQLLAEQQDPTSLNYHHWLTPEEYASRFGVSQSDIDQIKAWLESQGFTVTAVGRGRTWLTFSGTAQQANTAFKTSIHEYNVNGVSHYANATDPSVPAALANLVSGLRGLNNFRLKPRSVKVATNPEMTSAGGRHNIGPGDLATIYDIQPLYNNNIDGTGQTIAIVGQTAINQSDITRFRTNFGLPTINLQQVLVPGRPNPGVVDGDLAEADLDIEWATAVARNATVIYVYSDDVVTSLNHVVDSNLAPVVSMSYGACEQSDLIDLPTMRTTAQQANAQGITWLTASGDVGAGDCEDTSAAMAQNGPAVDAPGSIPEVTSMGGTELNEQGGSYWGAYNANNPLAPTALSYIPEKVWNDTTIDGALSAGGGGTSIYFPRPVWQTGPGVPYDAYRHVPDLSLASSADHDGFYVFTGGSSSYYGGTSVAAPSMAGIVVLLNQYLMSTGAQKQPGVGNINPTLYRLAQTPGIFHDVTVGDNMVPCVSGSPGCTTGSFGFAAVPGYDLATGLGSPDANNLIHAWSAHAATASAVVPSIDSNPVFQQPAPVNGNNWTFTLTLTEEAGVATTLTSFKMNGQTYDIVTSFGSATIPPNGSLVSKNLGFANLAVPKTVLFEFAGVDVSGSPWSEQFSVPFTGVQVPLSIGGLSNAASGQQTYAPGMIVSVYGASLGNFAQSAATLPLPMYLAGFEAMVNSVPAPLYFVSPNQVNMQIPYETSPGQATVTVGNPYVNVDYKIQIASAAPGIFGSGGFISKPFDTAKSGQATTLFITGEGAVRPSLATGTSPDPSTPVTRLPKAVLPVSVTVGGEAVALDGNWFYGIPSGLVGVTQINFTVPAGLAPGVYPVVVTVGSVASPPVNLTVTQ